MWPSVKMSLTPLLWPISPLIPLNVGSPLSPIQFPHCGQSSYRKTQMWSHLSSSEQFPNVCYPSSLDSAQHPKPVIAPHLFHRFFFFFGLSSLFVYFSNHITLYFPNSGLENLSNLPASIIQQPVSQVSRIWQDFWER